MAEAVAVGAGIAVVKAAVGGLLSELVKDATSPEWNRNKNSEKLRRMLAQLEPIVGSIPSSAPNTVTIWLENLRTRLEVVKHLLLESIKRRQFSISKKQYSNSKSLAKEVQLLSEILSTAPVLVLPLSILASADVAGLHERCKDISEQLEEFRNEVLRQDLAQITRAALETPTKSYVYSVDLMTANKAYSSIKDEVDSILSTSTDGAMLEATGEQASSSTTRSTYRRLDNKTVFGGDEVVEDAKKLLLEENEDKVGLWASGGTGKTHAALRVFDDDTIQAHFSGGCFWLTVGRAQSKEKLLRNLRFLITGRSDVRRHISIEDLTNQVRMDLQMQKDMLIVLDDVWEGHLLLSVEEVVPSEAGCKIFVTTRNVEVLDRNHVKAKRQVPLLSPENSWKLFCWQAFRGTSDVPPELERLAQEVTRECGGLPLALKVIGSVFAGKTDRGFWKLSLEKLRNADILDQDHETQLYERLKLSVDELPTIHPNLKDCFFYFAAFPEDWGVQVYEDLLPLWRGERIVGNIPQYDPKLEACELVGWLVSRSLIELRSERPVANSLAEEALLYCTVHDVLRDLARYILQHKVTVTQRECLYEAGRALDFPREWANYSEGTCRSEGGASTLSALRLSVMSTNLKELPPKLLDAPKLQVFLLRNNPGLKIIPDTFFNNLRNIRVLDLRNTSISVLPKSIGTLKLLILLNVSHTPLETLPDSLGNLAYLEQLYLDGCKSLRHLPSSLSSLTRLRILTIWHSAVVWKDHWNHFLRRKCVLHDLLSLVALEQLRLTSNIGSQATFPAGLLTASKKLQRLDLLLFEQCRQFPDLGPDDLQHLESLKLSRTGLTSLPSSLCSLPLLHTLILISCTSLVSVPPLDRLPNLVVLDLGNCSELKFLPASFGRKDGFPALEMLNLYACDKVASFPELEDGAMPCLKFLELAGWTQFDTLPKSLSSLKNLRSLNLTTCLKLKTLEHDHLSFSSFVNLEELVLDACNLLSRLPESLALLPNFRLLKMGTCSALIPMELERAISDGRITIKR